MKKRTEGERQKHERALWYWILTATLPFTALMLSAAVVLLCVAFGRIRPEATIELGEKTPAASAFARSDRFDAAYETPPEERYQAAGDYRLRIRTGVLSVPVTLHVRDTVAPTAAGTETTISTKQSPTPDKLIRNLRDESVVKITFETAPAYGKVGDYDAVVLLEDRSGNRTRVPVTVHVRAAVDAITAEAGDPAPRAEDFLIDRYETVKMTPITAEMMHEPGEYAIRITADGAEDESRLIVLDTVPPAGKGVTKIVAPGERVRPGELVAELSDETAVETSFETEPDYDCLTPQTLAVILRDRGGNETKVYSTLLITGVKPVEIEARRAQLRISELQLPEGFAEAEMSWPFAPDEPGLHVITVLIDGRENYALIDVKDTTPPEISVLCEQWFLNSPKPVETFFSAEDVTGAALAYRTEPDWTKDTQQVTAVATDGCGNRSERTITLSLVPDVTAPVLCGMHDRYCYLDEPVSYLDEVSAVDDCDGEVTVTVDASAVVNGSPGSYPVTYSATDRAGNTATATVLFQFVSAKVTEERAREVADKYLAKILTDDMTLAEQVEAIYDYVFTHVRYSSLSNKQDWRSEAVRGLTKGRGDCFTSYAAARLLLERTDAQIVSVQRSKPNTHHYWMLVNIGTGWYHFDACRAWTGKYRCFMWTDAQTLEHSKSYWRYDKSLYPPVATEPYNGGN